MHRDDVVGIDSLEGLDGLRDDLVGRGRQVEAAHDRVDLVDAACLLGLADGVDHAGVAARRDHHEPAVLDVIRGGVLALEGVRDELARLGLDLRDAEVRDRARGAHRPHLEARGCRRALEVREPRNLARRERVTGDDRRLLGQSHLEPSCFEARAIELTLVYSAGRGGGHPVAEGVLASRVKGEPGLGPSLYEPCVIRERAVVVGVAVTDDERIGARGVELQDLVVVEQISLGEAEVEENLPLLRAAD